MNYMDFKIKKMNKYLSINETVNIHLYTFTGDLKNDRHRHQFVELVFANKGQVQIDSDEYTGLLSQGELFVHQKFSYHSLTGVGDKYNISLVILGVMVDPAKIDCLTKAPIKLTTRECKLMEEIIKEGLNVFAPPYKYPTENMKKKEHQVIGCEQLFTNLIEQLFIELIRKKSKKDTPPQTDSDENVMSISDIVEYIDQNFLEKITINQLTFLFNSNRSTICKKFKEKTGKTLNQYIADKKTEYAKELIAHTDKTFTQIAEKMNFESIQHFSHFFIKNTSISPSEYRKISKEK